MQFVAYVTIDVGLAEYGDEYGVRGVEEIKADLASNIANVVGETLRVADPEATARVSRIATKRVQN